MKTFLLGLLLWQIIVLAKPLELNAHTFSATVARNNVLVLFHTNWCKNCRPVHQVFEALSAELRESNIIIATVDAGTQKTVAYKEAIRSFPSVVLYHGSHRHFYEGNRKFDDVMRFITSRISIARDDSQEK
ncbi:protein disulfide isomerase, putative [Bodo saltans]|uniref:Protein disulfide isomerase, putative n=1 Tax=Bodo saltans TaxID=75058 RepID=A0A0S4ILN5_BODSA|nr:protein disulfide isomerase, putative [Bodo saltans]|eukprot:CUF29184.1 protein disulfide isomerase, putative [Bodo saltans]